MKKKRKNLSKIAQSFSHAFKGLSYAIKSERNLRVHLIIALMVLIISLFFDLTQIEIAALFIVMAMVIGAELINTAIEYMTDLITEEHHPMARIIKDIAAGAVLLSSICAAVVGYLIFFRQENFAVFGESIVLRKIAGFPPHVAAVALFLVFSISLAVKLRAGAEFSFAGGMPSIHTAVAFSLAVISYSLSSSLSVLFLSLLLALMVAQARVSSGIHTLWEVLAGAVIGTSLTLLILQIILI